MAIRINKLENGERKITQSLGNFMVLEHAKDQSVAPENAQTEYFMS